MSGQAKPTDFKTVAVYRTRCRVPLIRYRRRRRHTGRGVPLYTRYYYLIILLLGLRTFRVRTRVGRRGSVRIRLPICNINPFDLLYSHIKARAVVHCEDVM